MPHLISHVIHRALYMRDVFPYSSVVYSYIPDTEAPPCALLDRIDRLWALPKYQSIFRCIQSGQANITTHLFHRKSAHIHTYIQRRSYPFSKTWIPQNNNKTSLVLLSLSSTMHIHLYKPHQCLHLSHRRLHLSVCLCHCPLRIF